MNDTDGAVEARRKGLWAKWFGEITDRFMEDVILRDRLLKLAREGIRTAASRDAAPPPTGSTAVLCQTASEEISSGFPRLTAWAVIALWTHVEVFTDDLVESCLKHSSEFQGNQQLDSLVQELQSATSSSSPPKSYSEEDVKREVRNRIKKSTGQNRLPAMGGDRFEKTLQAIGVAAELDQVVKDTLTELAQVRNIIVHQASIVDAKLLTKCPWLKDRGVREGMPLTITAEVFDLYRRAVAAYLFYAMLCVASGCREDKNALAELKEKVNTEFADVARTWNAVTPDAATE